MMHCQNQYLLKSDGGLGESNEDALLAGTHPECSSCRSVATPSQGKKSASFPMLLPASGGPTGGGWQAAALWALVVSSASKVL
jgi:hypothetical protein